ncbi:MAG TPA: cupin domain-containing protein [Clostridium sp.]|nr:cupin domain-containing protein [Clostridium sp.]
MYNNYNQNPYYINTARGNYNIMNNNTNCLYQCPYCANVYRNNSFNPSSPLKDHGPEPFVVNIEELTKENSTFRTALWTGNHFQLTLMSIDVGGEIGLELHPNTDQFIRIEEGEGIVKMGDSKDNLNFQQRVYDDYAFIIPAGKWHNLINTGNKPIKLYSIYAPPQHPKGTVHPTKAVSDAAEGNHV